MTKLARVMTAGLVPVVTLGLALALTLSGANAENTSAPVTDAATTALGYSSATPPTDLAARRCTGADKDSCKLDNQIVSLITQTPCTAQITMTLYSISYERIADALLDKAKCAPRSTWRPRG